MIKEQFNGAMFDRDGNRTPVYDYVKTAGIQIEAVDEVLMCCKSKGVIVSGSMPWDGNSGIPAKDILQTYGVNSWNANIAYSHIKKAVKYIVEKLQETKQSSKGRNIVIGKNAYSDILFSFNRNCEHLFA